MAPKVARIGRWTDRRQGPVRAASQVSNPRSSGDSGTDIPARRRSHHTRPRRAGDGSAPKYRLHWKSSPAVGIGRRPTPCSSTWLPTRTRRPTCRAGIPTATRTSATSSAGSRPPIASPRRPIRPTPDHGPVPSAFDRSSGDPGHVNLMRFLGIRPGPRGSVVQLRPFPLLSAAPHPPGGFLNLDYFDRENRYRP